MPTVIRETSCARTCLARGRRLCVRALQSPLIPFVEMAEDVPAARWVSSPPLRPEEVSPRLLFGPLAR